MYWLETKSTKYKNYNGRMFSNFEEAINYYGALVTIMKYDLPEEEWFDLKLMRNGKYSDFMPERDQVVRSWVY